MAAAAEQEEAVAPSISRRGARGWGMGGRGVFTP